MPSENIKTINTISDFLLKPTSNNFIKIFEYVRTQKKINWEVFEKDIEKKLNSFTFDHSTYQDFIEELWIELSYFDFNDIITQSTDFSEEEKKPIKSSGEEVKPNLPPNFIENMGKAMGDMIDSKRELSGGNLVDKDGNLIRSFAFFQTIRRLHDHNIFNDITQKNLQNVDDKAQSFSSILAQLLIKEENPLLHYYDKQASYRSDRKDLSEDSISFLSVFIMKCLSDGIEKEDGAIDEVEKIDLLMQCFFLKLFFGKYHHKTLCQKYLNKILFKLSYKDNLFKFENSYSNFFDNKINSNMFIGMLAIFSPYFFHTVPQAALTIFLRELLLGYYDLDGIENSNNQFVHFCKVIACLIVNNFSHGQKNSYSINVEERPGFNEGAPEYIDKILRVYLGMIQSMFSLKKVKKETLETYNFKINKSLYIPPSISFDLFNGSNYDIDWYFDQIDMDVAESAINRNIIGTYLIRNANNQSEVYAVNPFPTFTSNDLRSMEYNFFDDDSEFYDLEEFTKSIYCLPLWLEPYQSLSFDNANKYNYLAQITNLNLLTKNGLEDFGPVCFLANYLNMIFETYARSRSDREQENKTEKIHFNIIDFKKNYNALSSNPKYKSELNVFNEIFNTGLISPEFLNENFGVLEYQCLYSIMESVNSNKKLNNNKSKIAFFADDLLWIKKINDNCYKTISSIREEIISSIPNDDDTGITTGIMARLRSVLEELRPKPVESLIDYIKNNKHIKNKYFVQNNNLNVYGVGSWSYIVDQIIQLNDADFKSFINQLSDELHIKYVTKISKLNSKLSKDFIRQTKTLNIGAHGENLRLKEVVGVFEFISTEIYFGEFIK
jgi:hypothetical protein